MMTHLAVDTHKIYRLIRADQTIIIVCCLVCSWSSYYKVDLVLFFRASLSSVSRISV